MRGHAWSVVGHQNSDRAVDVIGADGDQSMGMAERILDQRGQNSFQHSGFDADGEVGPRNGDADRPPGSLVCSPEVLKCR